MCRGQWYMPITYAKTKFTLLVLIVTLVGLSQFYNKGMHKTGLCLASTIDTRIGVAII